MVTKKFVNTDLTDRFVEAPLTETECAQVLAYFLPLVALLSPAAEPTSYGNARRELSAALQYDLPPDLFETAVEVATNIECRRIGMDCPAAFEFWTGDKLVEELSWLIDRLLDGLNR